MKSLKRFLSSSSCGCGAGKKQTRRGKNSKRNNRKTFKGGYLNMERSQSHSRTRGKTHKRNRSKTPRL
jgi:hypothetical protein